MKNDIWKQMDRVFSLSGSSKLCAQHNITPDTVGYFCSSHHGTSCFVSKADISVFVFCLVSSTILSLPKCGKGKPALVRRNTVDDKSELIACIETGNFAKAARIAAGKLV